MFRNEQSPGRSVPGRSRAGGGSAVTLEECQEPRAQGTRNTLVTVSLGSMVTDSVLELFGCWKVSL
jgi:hypothetical protein